jgi:hypothetical protein
LQDILLGAVLACGGFVMSKGLVGCKDRFGRDGYTGVGLFIVNLKGVPNVSAHIMASTIRGKLKWIWWNEHLLSSNRPPYSAL